VKGNANILDDLISTGERNLRIGKVTFYTNQIICYEVNDDICMEVNDVRELAEVTKELTDGVNPV
jgi:hypothetical protein